MKKKNLKDKLTRFDAHINSSDSRPKKSIQKLPSRYNKLAKELGGELVSNFAGSYCRIDRQYPLNYKHGNKKLSAPPVSFLPVDAYTVEETGLTFPIDKMLFFDIETTGLGGSGAVPFLIGFGSFTETGFEVRQYLLADYPDETAVLEDILSELSDSRCLVSYNGAAFDLPFIKDRMIINRVARDIPLAGHIDLLHATRRFFRRRLKDCTLSNIEREVFDFHRRDDIPGYLVPSVYFEWLSSESLDLMGDVLEHNRLDIVSLYFLALEISDIYSSDGETLEEIDDLHSLSRLYNRRKKIDQVQQVYKKIDALSDDTIENDILLFHSFSFKKTEDYRQAIPIWKRLSETSGKEAYIALVELAKYYEHREKDFTTALKYARIAQKMTPENPTYKQQLDNRILRLKRKNQE